VKYSAAASLAIALACAVLACGGGHHAGTTTIHYESNTGDDDAAADDDAAPAGACAGYAAEFFGMSGCFPDAAVYNDTLALCGQLAASNNPYANSFFGCLENIQCAHYTNEVALWNAINACLNQLPS
jgi:hypothetical protein